MAHGILGCGLIGQPAQRYPYLIFPVAFQTGILKDPEAMAAIPDDSLGVAIANGLIPNNKGAGIIDLRDHIVAFDHASIEAAGNQLYIFPASKEAVDRQGAVVNEGAILMHNRNGLLKVAALAIDTVRHPWQAYRLNSSGRRLGKIAVFPLGQDAPVYEITDLDSASGLVTAKQRNRFF